MDIISFIPKKVLHICNILQSHGYESFIVGGSIRDILIGNKPHDFDIATNAEPNIVVTLFDKVILTGIKHGTVTVVIDNENFEITTYRCDGNYSDGRHPDDVVFTLNLNDDLSRRDFTINAIAYDPINNNLVDLFGGINDIKNKLIKAVGDPNKRFQEDGLRIMRAIRFVAQLGFDIEKNTYDSISKNLSSYMKVSKERIHDELFKIMNSKSSTSIYNSLIYMMESGILENTIPELMKSVNCAQNKYHKYDVFFHTLKTIESLQSSDPLLRLAALFHDIGKPYVKAINPSTNDATFYDHEKIGAEITEKCLTSLKFSNKDISTIVNLVRHHYIRYDNNWSNATIRRWIKKVGESNVNDLLILAEADISSKVDKYIQNDLNLLMDLKKKISLLNNESTLIISNNNLDINGSIIMKEFNLKSGKIIGDCLKYLLELVIDEPKLNKKELLLQKVKEFINNHK